MKKEKLKETLKKLEEYAEDLKISLSLVTVQIEHLKQELAKEE